MEPRQGLGPGECYCLVGDGGEGEVAGHSGLQKPPRSWIWCDGKSTALYPSIFLIITFFFVLIVFAHGLRHTMKISLE